MGKMNFLVEMRNVIGSGMHGWKCYKDPKAVPTVAQWYDRDDMVIRKYGLNQAVDKDWYTYTPGPVIRGLLRDKPHGEPKCNGVYYIVTD